MRKYWSNPIDFDDYIKEKILLSRKESCCIESHPIWLQFQPKFMMTYGKHYYFYCIELYNNCEFFEKILYKVFKVFIKEMVFVLELRHIFGMVIDDEGKPIGV